VYIVPDRRSGKRADSMWRFRAPKEH
jgi:hypothetical protein